MFVITIKWKFEPEDIGDTAHLMVPGDMGYLLAIKRTTNSVFRFTTTISVLTRKNIIVKGRDY